ncbi:TonB-dependent receptor [Solimonas sp. SE-A11]|uniref:TonB-dependent receptor n=1 Tax=Solimonas sp. SE-A11 TaxID=3054954 RepID=UPI00259C6918|nr:TonB-dependent receptor [Solimonas sp. SE-A11]MDM4768766.1 TonB-dependent receptor [Solimonas sp. SE-A11]
MLHKKSAMGAAALLAVIPVTVTSSPALAQDTSLDDILESLDAPSSEPASQPAGNAAAPAPASSSADAPPASADTPAATAPPSPAEVAPEVLDTIPVQAKDAAAEPTLRDKRQGPAQIEEIVVTATKREQSIREIPASISAFSGEKLENSGSLDLNDFIRESPGVTVAQGAPGFSRMTFRGISTDTLPSAGNAQPVGIFIGDTPFTDPYIANIVPDLSAFDLAGVQVLKGPQGTLFGGAALSGAIRYELQEPVLDTWQLRGFSQYTGPDHGSTAFTHGLSVNTPVGDEAALRLAYIRREYPGITDDLRSGKRDVAESSGDQVRAQALWKPGDWKIKFTHITQTFEGDNQLNEVRFADGPRATDQSVLPAPSKHEFGMNSLEVAYDFDSMRLVSLTSHVHRDANFSRDITYALAGNPPPGYPAIAGVLTQVVDDSKSLSQELRLQSNDSGPFDWLVGAYFFDYDLFFNILIDTPLNRSLLGPGSPLGNNPLLQPLLDLLGLPSLGAATSLLDGTSDAKSQERAIFADVSYDFENGLTLSAGGRFYETEVTGGFVGYGLLVSGNQNQGLGSDSRSTLKERGFNPKLSATYRFTDDVSLYATAAKGFRFGGLQSLPSTPANGVPPTYKSDTLWNYELGLRTEWLDNTLQADLTLFYIDYKDPIITQTTETIPLAYNTNVSAAVSRGLEANLLWNTPIPGVTWSVSGAMTDAHITEEFTASNGDTVYPGQEMPGAAKYQYSTSLQSLLPLGRVLLAPSVGYTYIGKGYSNLTHDVEINDYGSLNAGLLIATEGVVGNPKLAINMTNILDEAGVVAGGAGKTLLTQQTYEQYLLSPPRTLTARFSFEF